MSWRNRRYDRGVGVDRVGVPVISVGNLSVGGTGKTPMVVHVVRDLLAMGRRACIAMRGYGIDAASAESDEAEEYRRVIPECPVLVGADRHARIMSHLASGAATDCVVLDDGFQHRQLARDLDLVLVDCTRPPWADRLLPSGWLREGVASLRRADGIVLTHAESLSSAEIREFGDRIKTLTGRAATGVSSHAWECLIGGTGQQQALESLHGKCIAAACAIGNPDAFLNQAERTWGVRMAGALVLRDHASFTQTSIQELIRDIRNRCGHPPDALLTTEKDWSRMKSLPWQTWDVPVLRPVLRLSLVDGGASLRMLISSMLQDFKTRHNRLTP